MGTPYVGEIRMFGGNFAPAGWAFCNGQQVPISENDTLFTLIGTTYGGDGQETFCLPDLQGRIPVHAGQGPGISQNYTLGEKGGVESVTLTTQQIPVHTHVPMVQTGAGNQSSPAGGVWAFSNLSAFNNMPANVSMANTIQGAGGSQPHENMMPFLAVSFIISLYGVFPQQN